MGAREERPESFAGRGSGVVESPRNSKFARSAKEELEVQIEIEDSEPKDEDHYFKDNDCWDE